MLIIWPSFITVTYFIIRNFTILLLFSIRITFGMFLSFVLSGFSFYWNEFSIWIGGLLTLTFCCCCRRRSRGRGVTVTMVVLQIEKNKYAMFIASAQALTYLVHLIDSNRLIVDVQIVALKIQLNQPPVVISFHIRYEQRIKITIHNFDHRTNILFSIGIPFDSLHSQWPLSLHQLNKLVNEIQTYFRLDCTNNSIRCCHHNTVHAPIKLKATDDSLWWRWHIE